MIENGELRAHASRPLWGPWRKRNRWLMYHRRRIFPIRVSRLSRFARPVAIGQAMKCPGIGVRPQARDLPGPQSLCMMPSTLVPPAAMQGLFLPHYEWILLFVRCLRGREIFSAVVFVSPRSLRWIFRTSTTRPLQFFSLECAHERL